MNFPIKPVCNNRFIRKNGTCLIYIQYCFSPKSRTLLNTEIAIPPEFWNQKKECISEKLPKSFGIADELNNDLKKKMRVVEDIIAYASKEKVTDIGSFC